mgnify:CR=1 FL=1
MLSLGPRIKTAYPKLLVESTHLGGAPHKSVPPPLLRSKVGSHQEHRVSNDPRHDHGCPVGVWHMLNYPQITPSASELAKAQCPAGSGISQSKHAFHTCLAPNLLCPLTEPGSLTCAIAPQVHGGTWMKRAGPVGLGVRGISTSRGHLP